MADRKAELEKKKAKLQAIREEKERRKKQREQRDVSFNLKLIVSMVYLQFVRITDRRSSITSSLC